MNPICRSSRATSTKLVSSLFPRSTIPSQLPFQKGYNYSHEGYGSNDEPHGPTQTTQDPSATRRLEHPGPPPPNTKRPASTSPPSTTPPSTSQSSTAPVPNTPFEPPTDNPPSSAQTAPPIPSNKAHPTLNDGRQSPNVDERGELRPDVPEDVRRHNEEVRTRYDKSYNKIGDGGKVEKGFWTAYRH